MHAVCWVAAKAPRPGLAKTRLARDVGEVAALALYRAFLRDLAARLAGGPTPVGWYVTPPDAWDDLRPLVEAPGETARVLAQPDGDWTARQRALLRGAPERGEDATILIASDSPQLGPATIAAALDALGRHRVVLGPTHDGGYYLIGVRGAPDVLAGVRMSTGTVTRQVIAAAAALGAPAALLPATFDVDEAGDLAPLARLAQVGADLPATRAALAEMAA